MSTAILRLLDANGNRAAEGLRVLEDVARFVFDDARIAGLAKELRHTIRQSIPAQAVDARDTAGDVGTTLTAAGEMERARPLDLIRANAARVAEALRAAEEGAKLLADARLAGLLEGLRYRLYQLESALLARFPAWQFLRVRLYALVDISLTSDPVGVAAAVARGGAGAVQLRAKNLTQRDYRELAVRVQEVCLAHHALFIVNDHVAIARAIQADGVHVGQDDLAVADVRSVVGPGCAIGLSCHTADQARVAMEVGADYLGLGPMFATPTKPHEPCRGPELLDAVRPFLDRPSYAIGGFDAVRLRELRARLPHGAAVAGALCRAADPERAAAELLTILVPDEFG